MEYIRNIEGRMGGWNARWGGGAGYGSGYGSMFCDKFATTCGKIKSWSTCKTDFAKLEKGSGNGSANTQACRVFHLSLAQKGMADAKIHCPHAAKMGGGVCVSAKGKGYATKAIALPWFNVQCHFRLPSLTL